MGAPENSWATAPFFRKRYWTSPSAQPPGLVVAAAEKTTVSPFSKKPLWLASSTVRPTVNPLSPCVESHFVAGVTGQVTAGFGWASGIGAICVVIAPVILMSSIHQPSSFRLSFQQVPEAQP